MDPDQILRAIRQAAIFCRATSGRQGMVVHLPEGAADVVVAGDLHGNLANLRAILELTDLDTNSSRHLVLQEFVHGPGRYPDGGDTSHRLLDAVCLLKTKYPNRVHLLLGNHELAQWTGRKIAKDGVSLNDLFEQGVESAYHDRADDFRDAYDELFSSLLLAVRTVNRVFISHSIPEGRYVADFDVNIFDRMGMDPDELGPKSPVYRLVWGKDSSEETADRFAALIEADFLITGHIAQESGFAIPNARQIILDCVARPAACLVIPLDDAPSSSQDLATGIRMLA